MSETLILKNVRPWGETAIDLTIADGRIADTTSTTSPADVETIDGKGAIVLPGFVEAHTHLDKTLFGMPWNHNNVGSTLIDKITNERNSKARLGLDPARQSARQVALSVAHGTTHIRSHVDIDTEHGLNGVLGVMATREKYADVIDLEIVAFPQSGMLIRQGTKELMDEALSLGAEVVGGLDPCSVDLDPKGHLDVVFALAEKHGKPIDIHLHELGELGAFTMRLIIDRTRAHAMAGKVTVSHAFCLGHNDYLAIGNLLDDLADAGIAIMTTGPAGYPCPPLIRTLDAGITVCSGSDGIRDCWSPYGNADMLERAIFLGMRNDLDRDDEIRRAVEVVTTGGAAVMGRQDYGLAVGDAADLVLIEGETLAEAVVSRRSRPLVMKRGKVVAREGAALFETE
ncbi:MULTISPECIES: amidohydrolase family protein [unclassified Mesorhizobium]|uniref:amidohydrolase family protein n=1 Tax=unclassified Mesorhizobium TaxID=325217 RepID=UPI0030148694